MVKGFQAIKPGEIKDNPFTAIGRDGMLITAGSVKEHNMMTASWGAFGVLWHREVCFCFIRPQRHTRGFVEAGEFFTLSFFDKRYKKALDLCGSRSGRDINKTQETGLTAFAASRGAVAFKEARLVVVCRKIYHQDITPKNFIDPRIEKNYPLKDYHRMYVGEVVKCLKK